VIIHGSKDLTAELVKKLGAAFGRNQIDPTDF
jgi:plasmid maintenance system antidote protein VapI